MWTLCVSVLILGGGGCSGAYETEQECFAAGNEWLEREQAWEARNHLRSRAVMWDCPPFGTRRENNEKHQTKQTTQRRGT
jgi:hypothetical protein